MYSRAIVRSVQVLVSATSDRAMLVGQACQDVAAHSGPLFFFVSLSPLSFPPVFLLFHWVKNERCF